ncbi:MAG: helix-hairpin-helix domain-containing protein [Edaphobacter sp.]|uniref:ComEA family DNA-binding protein n=1 Tax=Edaphobacter sp. TaxID=1934404 RepID=UPI002389F8D8|nr:helix-hairpin-helix domain-containing protein [Edaphobacter sp.]MDE1177473.1 helix-hairpin-helix domain-containing protein [Edaphobacter sp.]
MRERSLRGVACVLALGSGVLLASSAVHAASGQAQADAAKPASQYPKLPDGPGRDTLIRVCGKCHSPMNVVANGQNREGWESEITKMAGLGASASDEEFSEILDYVSKNFPPVTGKVNVNKASAADIEAQLGLTTKQSEAIVAYREKNGDFKTLDDLKKVPDMEKEVDFRRNRIAF